MIVELWCDGSSTGEVGPGGWAYVLRSGTHEKEASGYVPETTNQRMEMVGCLMGLRALRRPVAVCVHTDSAYLKNAFTQEWLKKWKSNGWMAGGSRHRHPVVNRDLWEALLVETARHNVTWKKVKGHSGNADNDRVDLLAVTAKKAGMDAFVEIELAAYEALTLVGS
jgi:ribonuclease HI